ncbi:MAG: transglycosylase SLT domain-containing protein [Syntrophales bacterium]|nr:transglycosylase SLT domain-containing protein [Syntrophales bacterium]MDY0045013.1 transglycosylase SLT domain-containing protein [Syntrophales bacterium]
MKSNTSLFFIFICLAFSFTITSPASGNPESPDPPFLINYLRMEDPITFCGETVPLDNQDIRERFEKEMLLSLWNRPQVILWIKRSNRHFPLIGKMLKDADMPDDLKYIALIESALLPHAGSSKGAIGYWQFTASTGKKYGLTIDEGLDERRSLHASTRAALHCLKEYHGVFNSWTLAAAAYNMGLQGMKTEILAQKTNDYYSLYLPLETQRYILRIAAAKLIISNPEKYGFLFTNEDLYQPYTCERITFKSPERLPVRIVAEAANTSFKVIKDLNPEIRGYYLNEGTYSIFVPAEASEQFHSRYTRLLEQWMSEETEYLYTVKKGDNLSIIADRFNVPLPALFLWNDLEIDEPIHPGDRLLIYPQK